MWDGQPIQTAIFKTPAGGPVRAEAAGLAGDVQADPLVHGGVEKAVYAYPAEHYGWWRDALPELAAELTPGAFGENLTVEGLGLEDDIHVADRFAVGSAELVVTQPRLPCFKLGLRFGRPDMVRRFLASGRTGFYLSVRRAGWIAAGDPFTLIERRAGSVPVSEITRLFALDREDSAGISRLLAAPGIPESWREWMDERLERNASLGD
jgi:MOSC domain-containing protein YiiM